MLQLISNPNIGNNGEWLVYGGSTNSPLLVLLIFGLVAAFYVFDSDTAIILCGVAIGLLILF